MSARLTLVLAVLAFGPALAQTAPPPPVAAEEPYMLDTVETTAAREREIVIRTVLAGLKRNKSIHAEDSELIVCEKGKRTGTSITTIRCGKNRTWLALGAESLSKNAAFLGTRPEGLPPGKTNPNQLMPLMAQMAAGTPYNARLDTELMEFDLSILKNQEQFKGDVAEHDARVYELLEKERLAKEAEKESFVRFVLAWNELRRLDAAAPAGCAADPVCSSAHDASLERAILDSGLTIEQYNNAVQRLESDAQFRSRVVAMLERSD